MTEHNREMLADLMKAAMERGIDVPRLIADVITERITKQRTGTSQGPPRPDPPPYLPPRSNPRIEPVMPETPDFESIAERIAPPRSAIDPALRWTLVGMIVEHLVMVWNARGAADLAKIDLEFADDTLTLKSLNRALRSLDR
jgi:hypothetical protein